MNALTAFNKQNMYPPALPSQQIANETKSACVNIEQLNKIAQQLNEQISQVIGSATQELMRQIANKQNLDHQLLETFKRNELNSTLPVSAGKGNLRGQVNHIQSNLLQYLRNDIEFSKALGSVKMGKVLSAEIEENDEGYLLSVHIDKPFKKKVLNSWNDNMNKQKVAFVNAIKQSQTTHEAAKRKKAPSKDPSIIKNSESKMPLKTKEPKPPEEVEHEYFETEEYEQEGTLKPEEDFDCEADCQALRKAMKGLGTDEKAIINIMARRSFKQRSEIVLQFKTMFGKDLRKEFHSELSGNFLRIIEALCMAPDEYSAKELNHAVKGVGTDDDYLIEVLCSMTNAQIKMLEVKYKELYNETVEDAVVGDTSGNFRRILVSLVQGNRPEVNTYDMKEVESDADALIKSGIEKTGTDESKFIEILMSKSSCHLRALFQKYEDKSGKTIEETIKSEFSGNCMRALITIIRCIQNKPGFFAKTLHKSMKGLGTKDRSLLHIIIMRCEIDMVQIKEEFESMFGKSLGEWIKSDTSGDYRRTLLTLINEDKLLS